MKKQPEPPQSGEQSRATRKRASSRKGSGKVDRTALQLARQEKVFKFRVIDRLTVRQVSAKLGIAQQTVIDDERAELQRRAAEIADRRDTEKAAHLALLDDLYRQSMARKGTPGTGALGAAAKALEMRAKVLGIDAPTKIEVGPLQDLLTALDE